VVLLLGVTLAKPNVNDLKLFTISIGWWHANIPWSHYTWWFGGMYYTMIWTTGIGFLLSLILSHEIQSCSCFSLPEILFFFLIQLC
jgi:ABC-type multidrug transport system permease subunit